MPAGSTDDEFANDGDLIAASQRRPELFGKLYRRHAVELTAFFYRRTTDPHVSADLLAETFAVAFEKRNKYKAAKGSGKAWLYGIAKIELARYRRKQTVELRAVRKLGIDVPQLSEEDIERIEGLMIADALGPALHDAVDRLPPAEREAVQFRVVDGEDYDAIAARTGATVGALRVRVHRGLGRLATELGQ